MRTHRFALIFGHIMGNPAQYEVWHDIDFRKFSKITPPNEIEDNLESFRKTMDLRQEREGQIREALADMADHLCREIEKKEGWDDEKLHKIERELAMNPFKTTNRSENISRFLNDCLSDHSARAEPTSTLQF